VSADPVPGRRAWLLGLAVGLAAVGGDAMAEPRAVDLQLKGGRLPPNQGVVRVRQGDEVTLKWTSDQAVVLHLHGYDIEAKITPPAPAEMRFTARAAGRFPIEIHGAGGKHATAGYLEVHPR
jgi:FtsP/CotA-like multicopper oxidase with cupredoxin domain